MSITKADILKFTSQGRTKEFASKIYPEVRFDIRKFTAGERDRIEMSVIDPKTGKPDILKFADFRSTVVSVGAVLDGKPIFTIDEVKDLPSDLVQEVFDEVRGFNGMDKKDKAAEEAVGN